MLRQIYRRKLVVFCGFIIINIIVVFFLPFQTALVFYKENTREIKAYLPIKQGEKFEFVFKHSIHLTDVVEKYEIVENHQIMQYEIIFEEFGIGMPSNANEGEVFEYIDGKYHIKELSNLFEMIKIRNGKTVSENRLIWNNAKNEVQFNEYFEPGAWFTVKINRLTLWNMLKGVKIHG